MKPAKFQDSIKISENMAKVKKTKEFTEHKEVVRTDVKTIYKY